MSKLKFLIIVAILVLTNSTAFGGANETLLSSTSLKCADTLVTVEVWTSFDLESLDARKVVLTSTDDRSDDKAVLTFVTGSFGAECRSNSLHWTGYLVFQTACPARPSPTEKAGPCNYSNNYGIINGSDVLLVPHDHNGKLAAEIFEFPAKKTPEMKPVKTLFNVHKGK